MPPQPSPAIHAPPPSFGIFQEAAMTKTNIPIAPASGPIPDPIQAGLAADWRVTDCSRIDADQVVDADVVIVGSGAGGGVSAEILALAGLRVVIVEEGALKSSKDFKMQIGRAHPALYQESAARKTRDKAINIL